MSSLEHKNVVKVNSCIFDNTEDIMYIFMEYAESGDLSVLIDQAREKKKRIPENTIWKIIADVSDGTFSLYPRTQILASEQHHPSRYKTPKYIQNGQIVQNRRYECLQNPKSRSSSLNEDRLTTVHSS